jgi:hypothetical protein
MSMRPEVGRRRHTRGLGGRAGGRTGRHATEELEQKVDAGRGHGHRRRGEGSHGTRCVRTRDASLVLLRWNLERD